MQSLGIVYTHPTVGYGCSQTSRAPKETLTSGDPEGPQTSNVLERAQPLVNPKEHNLL